ncbi:MAG: hypothetical protein ACRCZ9_12765 [Fusobacteriaceae bacterium]
MFRLGPKKSADLKEIGAYFKSFYEYELYGKDLNNKVHDGWKSWSLKEFEKLAAQNPIHFLTKDDKNIKFFCYNKNEFLLNESLFCEIKNNSILLDNILERLEYRSKNYFRRKYMED